MSKFLTTKGLSNRMKKSLWYRQTKNRAEYLIKLMYYGN